VPGSLWELDVHDDRLGGLPSKGFEIAAFATVLAGSADRRGGHRRQPRSRAAPRHNPHVLKDALHTQRAHARYLHQHRSRYVFIVKGNQPTLHAQLGHVPWAQVPDVHDEHAQGHGRGKHRTLQLVSVAAGIGFPDARLAARVTRTRGRARTGKSSREVVYAVT